MKCKICKREFVKEMLDKNQICEYCDGSEMEVGGAIPSNPIGQKEMKLEPHGCEVMDAIPDISYGYECL